MAGCKYTNYERIRQKNVDDMVEIVYKDNNLMDEICNKAGDCPFGDDVQPSDCRNCVKEWLLRESDE